MKKKNVNLTQAFSHPLQPVKPVEREQGFSQVIRQWAASKSQSEQGPVNRPHRALISGPDGVGKTTLGSRFPSPLFSDVEDQTTPHVFPPAPIAQGKRTEATSDETTSVPFGKKVANKTNGEIP
jgi:hypothetical protein